MICTECTDNLMYSGTDVRAGDATVTFAASSGVQNMRRTRWKGSSFSGGAVTQRPTLSSGMSGISTNMRAMDPNASMLCRRKAEYGRPPPSPRAHPKTGTLSGRRFCGFSQAIFQSKDDKDSAGFCPQTPNRSQHNCDVQDLLFGTARYGG